MTPDQGLRVHIQGIVQGVGFRPFVFGLAEKYQLTGWVRNTTDGVKLAVDGQPDQLAQFVEALREEAPPLARIDWLEWEKIPPDGYTDFEILHSRASVGGFQPIAPDVSICADCLDELFDPFDHRYRYPFINCTNCGPRFTIIKDIPYDRPLTTMAPFEMCRVCASEYQDPHDRRFHAQPVACPDCGPHLRLLETTGNEDSGQEPLTKSEALRGARQLLSGGKILAVKGLGGFHLSCDAGNRPAVLQLRERKGRPAKPLALMFPDLAAVRDHCRVEDEEARLLASQERPIVLLERKPSSSLPEELAPGQNHLGVMLPYTPLHYLLFSPEDDEPAPDFTALVMTSGNLSGNPIVTTNREAREKLGRIADAVLDHNRDIHLPCDDSVTRLITIPPEGERRSYPLRRSRGYTPYPLLMPQDGPSLLGAGGELKNTFCLTRDRYAFLSQHLGNLTNYEALTTYLDSIDHFQELFRIQPEGIVCDAHPDYLATREAESRAEETGLPLIKVQHHHAHIASCLADNQLNPSAPVIGVAFDGTGYGDDGNIWGGEFLIADYAGYQRVHHLGYFPLPGGDRAVKEPWRAALGLLHSHNLPWDDDLPPVQYARELTDPVLSRPVLDILNQQISSQTNAPLTSSLGRLFDAVSALSGICQQVSYEAQAAIELEACLDPAEKKAYPFAIDRSSEINTGPLLEAVVNDLRNQTPIPVISARFHNGLAEMVLEVVLSLRKKYGLQEAALSGGVWQNITLLEKTLALLTENDFTVYTHQSVPANDGGISLGQVVIGQSQLLLSV